VAEEVSRRIMNSRRPSMSYRENFIRTVEFREPEYIPCHIDVLPPAWKECGRKLEEVISRHPMIFSDFMSSPPKYREPSPIKSKRVFKDPFGCTWLFPEERLQGQVVEHPLKSWENFKSYELPDPEEGMPVEGGGLIPWGEVYESLERARESRGLVVGYMPHGFFFQRLYYLRGFTNLLRDFIRKPPEIYELVERLTEYNLELVDRLLKFKGLDMIYFGDDLGTQHGLPVSPRAFRELILPSYKKIFGKVRASGVHVYLHSDGRVVDIISALIGSGVSVLNVEGSVNGLENLAEFKGRVCMDVYVDPQRLLPFGTPSEVRDYVKRLVNCLSLREGGLIIRAELNVPIRLENIEALCQAMEEVMWLT